MDLKEILSPYLADEHMYVAEVRRVWQEPSSQPLYYVLYVRPIKDERFPNLDTGKDAYIVLRIGEIIPIEATFHFLLPGFRSTIKARQSGEWTPLDAEVHIPLSGLTQKQIHQACYFIQHVDPPTPEDMAERIRMLNEHIAVTNEIMHQEKEH